MTGRKVLVAVEPVQALFHGSSASVQTCTQQQAPKHCSTQTTRLGVVLAVANATNSPQLEKLLAAPVELEELLERASS